MNFIDSIARMPGALRAKDGKRCFDKGAPLHERWRRIASIFGVALCLGCNGAWAAWRNLCPQEFLCSNWPPQSGVRYTDGQLFDIVSPSVFGVGATVTFASDLAFASSELANAARFARTVLVTGDGAIRPPWHGWVRPGHSTLLRTDGSILIVGGAGSSIYRDDGVLLGTKAFYQDPSTRASSVPTTPLVRIGSTLYAAGKAQGMGFSVFRSYDEGASWVAQAGSGFGRDGDGLFRDPTGGALWAIGYQTSLVNGAIAFRSTLFSSADHGASWWLVPAQGSLETLNADIYHVAFHSNTVYAASQVGVLVSRNSGTTWSLLHPTTVPLNTVAVAQQGETTLLLAGTANGVIASRDGGVTWVEFSRGLYGLPHHVYFVNGLLLAGSDAGWYICDDLDCGGAASFMPAPAARGEVPVVEFYHAGLDHYFITSDAAEAAGIDAGMAGAGWARTGYSFTVWTPLGNPMAKDVCRFYGSPSPGPNSHFFSMSAWECEALHRLQKQTPASSPRWNFEAMVFQAEPVDPATSACREGKRPVYRAYNNGFARGVDSNHRFVTDPAQITALVARGWKDEGIAFCAKGV